MHPLYMHARRYPEKPALVLSDGSTLRFGDLADRSRRLSNYLRANGVGTGSVALIIMKPGRLFEAVFAAQTLGLEYAIIPYEIGGDVTQAIFDNLLHHGNLSCILLSADHSAAEYIVREASAHSLVLTADSDILDAVRYETAIAEAPETDPPDEAERERIRFTSGTTGVPQAVREIKRSAELLGTGEVGIGRARIRGIFNLILTSIRRPLSRDAVYLYPETIFSGASSMCFDVINEGGTTVLLERLESSELPGYIEKYGVTHMFVLSDRLRVIAEMTSQEREKYDVSSLEVVLHAGVPCSVTTKEDMLSWWGDVLYEVYAGTEGGGCCFISPHDWRTHKGSVGRPVIGKAVILDDNGVELPYLEIGNIYFTDGTQFEYIGDTEKYSEMHDALGRFTFGDVGYLDSDGFLYIVDRRVDQIVVRGRRFSSVEVEHILRSHPAVSDVAVVGIRSSGHDEQVTAFVETTGGTAQDRNLLENELRGLCRGKLSDHKHPEAFKFVDQLPRNAIGKVLKRELREVPAAELRRREA